LFKGRGVIDAVTDHGYMIAVFCLQRAYRLNLAFRQDAGLHLVDTHFVSHRPGCALVVAGNHYHVQTEFMHAANGNHRFRLDGVSNCDHAQRMSVGGYDDDRAPTRLQLFQVIVQCFQPGYTVFFQQATIADQYVFIGHLTGDTACASGTKLRYFTQCDAPFFGTLYDSFCNGVL